VAIHLYLFLMVKNRLTYFCKAVFFVFLFCVFAQAQKLYEISFTVSMPTPHTHLLEVEMRVRAPKLPVEMDLLMPVWTPGSYFVREYARHIQDFNAKDGNGSALRWSKTNKNTWTVETNNVNELVATYRVYSNELTVRTNELNDQHAFWNNAALLMYPKGQLKASSIIRVVPFGSWRVATPLPMFDGRKNVFRAENFDELYDSPFEVSDYKEIAFEAKGAQHQIVIDGFGNYDATRIRNDVKKIVETAIDIFGGVPPYKNYIFFLHLRTNAGGGLEHSNSCALGARSFSFASTAGHVSFLSLVAHEYFHLWNVKRIRPDVLGPFDYTQENYTKLLWVAEGITSYYDNLLVRRAGFISDKQFLNQLAESFQALQNRPGRFQTSLEEASFDAWIKGYRPDENSINREISYYDKGAIIGALLDLDIRNSTKGAKSLDDVMRFLYTDFYQKNRNYTPEDFQKTCEMIAGKSLNNFFNSYVRGKDEIDYDSFLNGAGLRLDKFGGLPKQSLKEVAYFGANLAQDGDRLVVRSVPSDTPAYSQGINSGDQIVALDGFRTNLQDFNARIAEKKPNDKIVLTIFRFDELRSFEIKLGGRINPSYVILPFEKPTEEQLKIYRGWMG
jgi:predicted metalloprotease with PDZ domain